MKKYLDSIRRFKFSSVFFRFYLLTFGLSLLLISIFTIYIYNVYMQNFSQAQQNSQQSFLMQTVEKVDSSIQQLNETVLSLSSSPEIVEAVIIPEPGDQTRNFETVRALRNSVENYELISNIYLYEDTAHMLYSSGSAPYVLENVSDTPLIYHCYATSGRIMLTQVKNRYDSSLVSFGEKLYLVCRFTSASNQQYMGCLAIEIDQQRLFSGLDEMLESTSYGLNIHLPANMSQQTLFSSDYSGTDAGSAPSMELTSDYSQWVYQLQIPQGTEFSFTAYARSAFPFLGAVLLIGLLLSVIIAARFYSPISRLLLSIAEDAPTDLHAPPTDEVEMISMTYRQMQSSQRSTEAYLQQIRPALESNLLLDLIAARVPEENDYFSAQIEAMHSELTLDGWYECYIFQLPSATELEPLVRYMLVQQIRQKVESIAFPEWKNTYFLRPGGNICVLILQYQPNMIAERILRLHPMVRERLHQQLSQIGSDMLIASGKPCQRLFDIPISYNNAKEELRRQVYYKSDADHGTPEIISAQNAYFNEKLQTFASALKNGEITVAEQVLTQFLKEIFVDDTNMDINRIWCEQILNLLVEQLLELRTPAEKFGAPEYRRLYQRLEEAEDSRNLYRIMVTESSRLISNVHENANKNQHKLVSQARDYIQKHYSNSDLSIHQIAEAIGISDSYLSNIFTQYTGENLVTYINSYRVDVAKDLLANTRIIIKDVGFKTGFNTVQNFNRVFKRFTGTTPGSYRKEKRPGDN